MQYLQHGPGANGLHDINFFLREKRITALFQQVVSVNRNCVCGLEGLIRGVTEQGLVAPKALFDAAAAQGMTLELDRLCRECVLGEYAPLYPRHRDKLLFINMEASVIEKAPLSGHFTRQVKEAGIDPGNIVIEISEAKVQDESAVKSFIDIYRSDGFLIALDDVGIGFSNLERISAAKPDIIKIDTSLVRNIHTDYHRQEVFKALVGLAGQIGALVVAEGVETEEEALQALKLGAHMIQGFYFSQPRALGSAHAFDNPNISVLAERFRAYMTQRIRAEADRHRELVGLVKSTIEGFGSCCEYEERLRGIVAVHDAIECAYVLDETGTQRCDAVFHGDIQTARRCLTVCALNKGTDHSMKNYYFHLVSEGMEHYITEPYVSPVTGSLCVTVSMLFSHGGTRCILCMDIRTAFQP
jgi:EAL domain-containing protein (putative c-di-GMP-specific phosphodiesterase class I)